MGGHRGLGALLALGALCGTNALKVEANMSSSQLDALLLKYGDVTNSSSSEVSTLDDALLRKQKCKGSSPSASNAREREAYKIIDEIVKIIKRNPEDGEGGGEGGDIHTEAPTQDDPGHVKPEDLDKLEGLGMDLTNLLGDPEYMAHFFRTALWYFTQDGRRKLKDGAVEVGKKVGELSNEKANEEGGDKPPGGDDTSSGGGDPSGEGGDVTKKPPVPPSEQTEEDKKHRRQHNFFMEFMRGYMYGKKDGKTGKPFKPGYKRNPVGGSGGNVTAGDPSPTAEYDYKLGYIVGYHVGKGETDGKGEDDDEEFKKVFDGPPPSIVTELSTMKPDPPKPEQFRKMVPATVAVVAMMGLTLPPTKKTSFTMPVKLGDVFGRKLLKDLTDPKKKGKVPGYDYFFSGLSLPLLRYNGILDKKDPDFPKSPYYMMGYRLGKGCSNTWPNSPDGDTSGNSGFHSSTRDMGKDGLKGDTFNSQKGDFTVHHDNTHTGYKEKEPTSYHRATSDAVPDVEYVTNSNKGIDKRRMKQGSHIGTEYAD